MRDEEKRTMTKSLSRKHYEKILYLRYGKENSKKKADKVECCKFISSIMGNITDREVC